MTRKTLVNGNLQHVFNYPRRSAPALQDFWKTAENASASNNKHTVWGQIVELHETCKWTVSSWLLQSAWKIIQPVRRVLTISINRYSRIIIWFCECRVTTFCCVTELPDPYIRPCWISSRYNNNNNIYTWHQLQDK